MSYKDSNGNEIISIRGERKGDTMVETTIYQLESGKTTLRTEHRKLRSDEGCKYPERLSCNYGPGFERCHFMKCISMGNWICTFNKSENQTGV